MQRSYVIGGNHVGIRTTSPTFGAWLDSALGSYAVDRWDGADYSLVVQDDAAAPERGRRDFSVLYKGTSAVLRTLDVPMLARALLNELSALLAATREDVILLAMPTLVGRDAAVLVSPRIAAAVANLGRRAERGGIGLPSATFSAVDPTTGRIVPLPPLLDAPGESW
ncbi:MAG: hypothetical protein M3133_09815, partial [Actinomycetota bacterium]|nr:hypothetical protein [Actinomycetota bacterium]